MSVPQVSIVLPVYNGEKYLREAIDGALAQSFADWELLIFDDGSTDQGPAIARAYAASHPDRVRCLEHPGRANHGQFATRVCGARQARAEVVALLDQDDVWDKDYLEKHLRVWGEAQAQGAYLSYGPGYYWYSDDPSGTKDFVQRLPPGAPRVFAPGELLDSFLDTLYANTPCPSCTLVRREVLAAADHFGRAARGSAYEDQYLWWHVAARWPVAVHCNAWVRYRQHGASALVQFTACPRHTVKTELTFLEAIRDDLAAARPDHPLLTSGKLMERIDTLSIAPAQPLQPGRKSSFSNLARKVLPRPVKQVLRVGLNQASAAKRVAAPAVRAAGRLAGTAGGALQRAALGVAAWVGRGVRQAAKVSKARTRLGVGVEPLSYVWCADRGLPPYYYYILQFMEEFKGDIQGHCVEFQEDNFATRFGGEAISQLEILHIDDSNPRATLVGDLTKANSFPSDRFDCIICTHVLHVIYELDKAVADMCRMLKPGGVLLVAVPLVSMDGPEWGELWRFTAGGLKQVLGQAFGVDNVIIRAYGNSLTAAGQLRGLTVDEFTPRELSTHDARFAVEVCGRARKPG